MVKQITVGKMKTSYLTEEDIVETEEYFQQAVVISSKQPEGFEETTAPQFKNTISVEPTPTQANIFDEKFNQYLSEAIDETLASLGEVVKNAVFEHLKNDFKITKADLPQKICEFSKIVHKVFGLGADRLELKIVKNLSSKLQVDVQLTEYEWPLSKWIVSDVSFTDYVEDLRYNYAKKKNL